jgi:hypothetical protein
MTLIKAEHFIIVGPMPFKWTDLPFNGNPKNTLVIFVDGGLTHFKTFQKKANPFLQSSISLGDGDSSPKKMQILKSDQDLSDLAFCLKMVKPIGKNAKSFCFVGFLGTKNTPSNRLDHLLFNISEIFTFVKTMKFSGNPIIKMENEVSFFKKGAHKIRIHSLFSFMSLEKSTLKLSGKCLYKTTSLSVAPLSSRGLSNLGSGVVSIESTKTFFLIFSE